MYLAAGRKTFQQARYIYLASWKARYMYLAGWKETFPAGEVHPCQLEENPSSQCLTGHPKITASGCRWHFPRKKKPYIRMRWGHL
jgi:hypothetical protein